MITINKEGNRTPLYNIHKNLGGRLVNFGGWALPVQYSGIIDEHNAVRNKAGIFDVSHMGEIILSGPEAVAALQHVLTADVAKIKEQKILYSLMCYEDGGIVDDLLVYCFSQNKFMLIVNAVNTEKDFTWLKDNTKQYNVEVEDHSDNYGLVALQGPLSLKILERFARKDWGRLKYFTFAETAIRDIPCLLSRTGYTGEDGFEIYSKPHNIVSIYEGLLEIGHVAGLLPCGLGARDTLRFEAGLPLYGNELGPDTNPLEVRLRPFVDLKKDFIGAKTLRKIDQAGTKRQLIGFEMIGQGIPRNGYKITRFDLEAGFVTSGTHSPSLKKNLGMGLMEKAQAKLDNVINVLIRNKPVEAKIVKLPFYKRYML